jgi:hypothetical protein
MSRKAAVLPGFCSVMIILLLSGCEIINTGPEPAGDQPMQITMVEEDFDFSDLDGASLLLIDAEIEEHVLRLDIVHRSGCVSREFQMFSTEVAYLSRIPQAYMLLIMEAASENCDEMTAESVRFSLAPFSGYEAIYLRIHTQGMEYPFVPMPLYEP